MTNYVVNAYSGKVLDDTNFSTSNGNQIQQWQAAGGTNQQWTFISLADGNDLIVNAYSGKVLDDTNFSTSNGTLIQQWQADGGINQQWRLVSWQRQRRDSQRVQRQGARRPNSSTSNGTPIQQ